MKVITPPQSQRMTERIKNFITIKYFKIIDGKRVEYTPPPRTIEQIIEDGKESYLRWIETRAESEFLDHPQLGRISNRRKPPRILAGLQIYNTPYIQPIKIISDDIDTRFEYAHRRNIDKYDEYPAISINLDFSDDAIIADIKKHLKN